MPGKEIKLIGKTLHPDGYYTATYEAASEAVTVTPPKRPHIKISFRFDKGSIINGPVQRDEKQEHAAAVAKEEIPTPGFVLLKESSVEDDYTSSSSTFQSKLDATKRKMHDSYQQLANAKKQRRIQVIDPRDLPPPPTDQSSTSKGKGGAVAARKKVITSTTNRKLTRNFFDVGGRSKLVKPTSIF